MSIAGFQPPPLIIETLQDFYSTILEYYDELFPVDDDAAAFFRDLQDKIKSSFTTKPSPLVRYLGIGCATGILENRLAGDGLDITGIDKNKDMIETAKRRMKRGFSTTRFFEMSALDMKRFLKIRSFNIIACLENTIAYISDETLIRKFFHDSRELLAPGGMLVIQTLNYDSIPDGKPSRLPDRKSVRVSLERGYIPDSEGLLILDASLELGNGRKIILQKTTKVAHLSSAKIKSLAREAGFSDCLMFGSFSGNTWTQESACSLFVFS